MKDIRKYTSIERYGKACTKDVLQVGDMISITEKLDGANASFRLDEENYLGVSCYSRNNPLTEGGNTLSGFFGWVRDNIVPIKKELLPQYIYYGEWLIPHKVRYKDECYRNFYLFSIWDVEEEKYLDDDIVISEAKRLGLKTTNYFYRGAFISFEHLLSFVGKSDFTLEPDTGEGIVVKNVNYFLYDRQLFVKLVSEKFAEVQAQKLPKNPNVNSAFKDLILSVLTKPRVEKLLFKLVEEGELHEGYDIEDMGTILRALGGKAYEDIMKEESELFEQYEENDVKKMVGKNVPNIIKEILKEQGRA